MELLSAVTLEPARARIARILRDDLPLVLRFSRAAVFIPGPSGRPRLLASTGVGPVAELDGPSRLRVALIASECGEKPGSPVPRTVAFTADDQEVAGEALVVPLPVGGALVVYRSGTRFSSEEVKHAVATARFVARALAWSAVFAGGDVSASRPSPSSPRRP